MAQVLPRIYIVRHGETEENRQGIMQGQLDTKLNVAGVEQAKLAAGALERVQFEKAFSSDLDRAAKTAEIILGKHPGVPLEKQEALRERYLGDWQGQRLEGRASTVPWNAEQRMDFSLRAARWWSDTIMRYVESHITSNTARRVPLPTNVLVVSHGGYISRLLANLLQTGQMACAEGVGMTTKCWNASISVVEIHSNGGAVLVSYSDTTHLKMDLVQTTADVING